MLEEGRGHGEKRIGGIRKKGGGQKWRNNGKAGEGVEGKKEMERGLKEKERKRRG
jgi:hypothetical protein